ncbi:MAG: hypothetical protein WBA53_10260 [Burkholderiaceae bacterium]
MKSDDRELRLRSHFGFMMVWTGLTIGIVGHLAGILLGAMVTAAGPLPGFAPGDSSQAVVQIGAHILVGIAVRLALIQSHLGDDRCPDGYPGDE